jgi:hypothetical protein
MMKNRLVLVASICAALASAPVLSHAQETPAPAKPVLSDSDKLEQSAESLNRMKAALKHVLGRVEEARNEKDVVKLNCVNEKLTQIKGLLKVAEQSDIGLHEMLATKDAGADAEFAKIGIARGKVDLLRGDAEQCIGQLAYIVDERTTVEVSQPSNLPNVDGSGRWFGAGHTGLVPAAPPPCKRPRPASP